MCPTAGHSSFLILHYIKAMMERSTRLEDLYIVRNSSRYLGQCRRQEGGKHREEVGRQAEEGLIALLATVGVRDTKEVEAFVNPLKAIIALGTVSRSRRKGLGCALQTTTTAITTTTTTIILLLLLFKLLLRPV